MVTEGVIPVAPRRMLTERPFWSNLAPWLGVYAGDLRRDTSGVPSWAVTLFRVLNLPWSTLAAVGAVLTFGEHFPHLTEEYVIAGLAGSATVARVAPSLAQFSLRWRSERADILQGSLPISAAASRRALGWALLALVVAPWLSTGDLRLDWLAVLIPASFAGRALWEPWWWRVTWTVVERVSRHRS
ncbi:MAG: hypothetical protein M1272_05750 [Firmicutes bacterium]|nr:hypothetical protein [Bacillota bacterium]